MGHWPLSFHLLATVTYPPWLVWWSLIFRIKVMAAQRFPSLVVTKFQTILSLIMEETRIIISQLFRNRAWLAELWRRECNKTNTHESSSRCRARAVAAGAGRGDVMTAGMRNITLVFPYDYWGFSSWKPLIIMETEHFRSKTGRVSNTAVMFRKHFFFLSSKLL